MHLALDEVLGRQVAIKRIGLIPGSDSAELERAEREARLAAALNHPHVVVGLRPRRRGRRALAGDGVRRRPDAERAGADLGRRWTPPRRRRCWRRPRTRWSRRTTDGIVHRDVKPSNILIADGVAKLNDFGIARSADDASLTQTGLVTGSPAYLAPEVASGSSATPASDVWSLGATLYHAVTGKPPYDVGDNLIGALYKIVHEDPPRLARRPPHGRSADGDDEPRRRGALDDAARARRAGAHRPWAALHRGPGPRSGAHPRGDRRAAAGAGRAAGCARPHGTAPAGGGWRPPRCSRSRPSWRRTSGRDAAPPRRCRTSSRPARRRRRRPPTGSTSPPVTAEDTREQMDAFITSYLATVTSDPGRPSTG